MICFGNVPAGSVLPIYFTSYDGATGASEAISGLAVTDIEIYKGVSITQRSSDNGYALIDTDGIDVDGVVGFNGVSVDLGDNSDAGFYAAGSFYTVVVASITADGQTVNFIAATFRIVAAEGTAGTPVADATRINNVSTSPVTTIKAVQGLAVDGVVPTVTALTGLTAADVGAIKAKTDNLPSDPADESLIIAATDALATLINALNNLSSAQAQTAAAAALTAAGITAANGVTKIAGHTLQDAGTGGQGIGA